MPRVLSCKLLLLLFSMVGAGVRGDGEWRVKKVQLTDYLIGVNLKIPDGLIKITYRVKVEIVGL